MLDHTMVLYGSGMNNGVGIEDGKGSHSTRKLPTLFAGGGKLGIKQGSIWSTIRTGRRCAICTSR